MSHPTTDLETVDGELSPGTQVGEYTVEGKLGQGAFGIVFKASHPVIGKLVAIKVLSLRFSVDPEMVSRFVAEARAVNQIRNRHIIDIFSFGKLDDGRQYYVMEYLDGETLDALVERQGRLPLAEAVPILRGIGKALDAAHAKGIAHRDLKAENVFLAADPDGGVFPKLLDFGIAKLLASDDTLKHKTRTGMSIGTPYYMSPEQARAKDVDHRTDIYAFGVLCYIVLTGKYPFDGDDYMSILMKQCTETAEPPSTHVPDLPKAVDDVIAWLMQKDPADRPDCLRTAVAALEAAATDAGIAIPAALATGPSLAALHTRPPNAGSAVSVAGEAAPARGRIGRYVAIAAVLALVAGGVVLALGHRGSPGPAQAAAPAPAAPAAPTPAAAATPAAQPAAPQPAAPQPAPVAPAPPPQVIVTIAGVPEGTEVLVAGKTVGAAPGPVELPRGQAPVVLVLKADGYLVLSSEVVPDHDQSLQLAMKKKPGGARPHKHSTKDDIIDVFGGNK